MTTIELTGGKNCHVNKHDVDCITMEVKTIDGKTVKINVDKCKTCGRYMLSPMMLEINEEKHGKLMEINYDDIQITERLHEFLAIRERRNAPCGEQCKHWKRCTYEAGGPNEKPCRINPHLDEKMLELYSQLTENEEDSLSLLNKRIPA